MRKAIIKYNDIEAGVLTETEDGEYLFAYNADYVRDHEDLFITFGMPVRSHDYRSKRLFPFFEGLIPEGWLLNIAMESWKIKKSDSMGLLLAMGKDCIGAVSVHEIVSEDGN